MALGRIPVADAARIASAVSIFRESVLGHAVGSFEQPAPKCCRPNVLLIGIMLGSSFNHVQAKNDVSYRESHGNLRQSAMQELSQLDFTTFVADTIRP